MAFQIKEYCPKGHPYFGDNLYRRPGRSHNECKICRKATQQIYQKSSKAKRTRKKYRLSPGRIEKERAYALRPEVKLRRAAYYARPEVQAMREQYKKKYVLTPAQRQRKIWKDRRYRKRIAMEKKLAQKVDDAQALICYSSKCRGIVQDHKKIRGTDYECSGCGRKRTIN